MTKNDLIKKLETKHLSWAWFAVLSYEGLPSRPIDGLFYTWIEEVEREDGDADFQWCRILDPYDELERVCFYVLVRGLRSESRHVWTRRWKELTGNAGSASIYDPTSRGGIGELMEEQLSRYGEFEVQYCLDQADVKWDRQKTRSRKT